MPRAVHQLVPVLSPGDAISASVIRFRDLIRERGVRSEIYASLVDRSLKSASQPVESLPASVRSDDVVIYHLSIGSRLAPTFAALRAHRVIYYHNITPAETLGGSGTVLAHHLRWGHADLTSLLPLIELALAPSQFNASDLHAAGAKRVAIVPLPVDLQRLRPRPATPVQPPVLVFVGRFAPHKRQDVLIKVIAALRSTHLPEARLVLVGAPELPAYIHALEDFARLQHVGEALTIVSHRLSDEALGDLYAQASVFLCASDHEGFCVPVVEAMAFSVPVIAYTDGAVGETVGAGGLVLSDRDPLVWAELAWRAISDSAFRSDLVHAGEQRLAAFGDQAIADHLFDALRLLPQG